MKFLNNTYIVNPELLKDRGITDVQLKRQMLIDIIIDLDDSKIMGIGTLDKSAVDSKGAQEVTLTVQDNIFQQTYSLN